MEKSKLKVFLILFAIVILISTTVFATDTVATPDTTSTATNEEGTANGETGEQPKIEQFDKVFTGEDITIDELIAGNVVAIGKNVTLTGGIGGNLYVVAENLNIEHGVVYGSVYAMASNIIMGHETDENGGKAYELYAACDTLTLKYYGGIQTDLKVMAKEISLDGVVFRNVYADVDRVIIDSNAEIQGDLIYTSQSEAIYMQKQESNETVEEGAATPEPTVTETTEIPSNIVWGEKKFTKRDKKIYNNDKEIINAVQKIVNKTKDMDDGKIKSAIVSNLFEELGIKSNNEITKKTDSGTMKIPSIVVYIDIAVIVVLILALVLPKINKSKGAKEGSTITATKKEDNK